MRYCSCFFPLEGGGGRVGPPLLALVPGVPRPRLHPRRELGLGELPQPVGLPDLLLVTERRLPPLGLLLDHRRIGDPELIRQVGAALGGFEETPRS